MCPGFAIEVTTASDIATFSTKRYARDDPTMADVVPAAWRKGRQAMFDALTEACNSIEHDFVKGQYVRLGTSLIS